MKGFTSVMFTEELHDHLRFLLEDIKSVTKHYDNTKLYKQVKHTWCFGLFSYYKSEYEPQYYKDHLDLFAFNKTPYKLINLFIGRRGDKLYTNKQYALLQDLCLFSVQSITDNHKNTIMLGEDLL